MAASAEGGEQDGLVELVAAARAFSDEETGGESPLALRLGGRRWRLPSRSFALAAVAAMCLAALALALLPPALPRPARRGPMTTGLSLAGNASIESKVEAPPAGFDYSTPLAIKWAPHPEDCVEVHVKSFSPEGQKLETMKCGRRSAQFLLEEGLQGKIRWSGHPEYCVATPGHGDLELRKCASLPSEALEFSFEDGYIRVKATPSDCAVVDSHTTDAQGRHHVNVQDCHAWEGDSLVPLKESDYKFAVDWPQAPSTTEAPTTKAPATPSAAPPARQPDHKLPSKIILKSTHGKYVVAELGGGIFANRPWADDWEKFGVVEIGEGSVALKTHHGTFLTANALGTVSALAEEAVPDAHFHVEHRDDGAIGLKTAHGKFLSAEPSGFMIGNRASCGGWEEFEVVDMAETWPDHVAIKSVHGKYLKAFPHGALQAVGNWPLDDWERFHVTHYADGTVSLRCDHGEYMVVEEDGTIHAQESQTGVEHFKVAHLPDGNFTMQSHTGKYVWADSDGAVLANHQLAETTLDKFQVVMVY